MKQNQEESQNLIKFYQKKNRKKNMKIRNGFVSNSSSSSFVVIGESISIKVQNLIDIMNKNNFNIDEDDVYECFQKFITTQKNSCECLLDFDEDSVYIGKIIAFGDNNIQTSYTSLMKYDYVKNDLENILKHDVELKLITGIIES